MTYASIDVPIEFMTFYNLEVRFLRGSFLYSPFYYYQHVKRLNMHIGL
jgi:hypothetical protein